MAQSAGKNFRFFLSCLYTTYSKRGNFVFHCALNIVLKKTSVFMLNIIHKLFFNQSSSVSAEKCKNLKNYLKHASLKILTSMLSDGLCKNHSLLNWFLRFFKVNKKPALELKFWRKNYRNKSGHIFVAIHFCHRWVKLMNRAVQPFMRFRQLNFFISQGYTPRLFIIISI